MKKMHLAIAAGVVVALAAVLTAVLIATAGDNEHVINEDAWRAEREAQGTEFTDWPQYVDAWTSACGFEDLDTFLAARMDHGATTDAIRTDVQYACPSRLLDLEAFVDWQADPCAGLSAEDEALIEEASGVPC